MRGKDAYDCAVIVSNDSDLAESLRLVKAQHRKLIGLVTPGVPTRKTSRQLSQYADFVKPIRTWMLQSSQLPDPIPGTTILKLVTLCLAKARVEGGRAKARRRFPAAQ